MANTNRTLPIRSHAYTEVLRAARKRLGMTQYAASRAMGVGRATWNRLECGRPKPGNAEPRPTFDSLAAMAEAVRMTFVLVPIGQDAPASAPPAPVTEPPPILGRDHQPRSGYEPKPEPSSRSRSVMAWLRERRRDLAIRHDDMAKRLGMGEPRLSGMERGTREPYFGDVVRYAEECGLSVALVEPEAAPLAGLGPKEAEAVRRLVVSYVDHCVRNGKPIPAGLTDAAEALDVEY